MEVVTLKELLRCDHCGSVIEHEAEHLDEVAYCTVDCAVKAYEAIDPSTRLELMMVGD